MRIEVYDPAMCCSTGVCGPSVDPQLVRFSADLEWLKSQGVSVERGDPPHRGGPPRHRGSGAHGSQSQHGRSHVAQRRAPDTTPLRP
jgi:hypothetical protein